MAEVSLLLPQWTNFYVIVGSSAGALTGLQFVTMALIAEAQSARSMQEIRAFGTPTIVHFCVVLLVSAIANMPWRALSTAALCMVVCGTAGMVYAVRVIRHTRTQTGYAPEAEDWFWYAALPLAAYAVLLAGGALVAWHPRAGLFIVAAAVLVLLFNGIHNAWDTVTYIVVEQLRKN